MIFTTYTFLFFLAVVFVLYWSARGVSRNVILIIASLIFYGWIDWRLCGLLLLSVLCAYASGLMIERKIRPKFILLIAIALNLGILGFFKYYNFFAVSISSFFNILGCTLNIPTLKLVLPIGISFYSFMSISYTVDVYCGATAAERRIVPFFAYMMFFPQLLAGPIGRAGEMLPQFTSLRTFGYDLAADGCRQMLWGAFKKVVIADNCARLTSAIALSVDSLSGSTLLLGAFIYAVQIYADFSGYSDIAIGCGKLFGIRLRKNFAFPYFASNIADFWRRWHISLTSWFRDYVYIPLGGSRCSCAKQVRNTFVVFILSGLWHGANWTFIVWGFIHACLFLPLILMPRKKNGELPSWRKFFGFMLTFAVVTMAWVFFSSPDIASASHYFGRMFSKSLFSLPRQYLSMMPWIACCLGFEWFQRHHEHAFCISHWHKILRWGSYCFVAFMIVAYRQRDAQFVYFQF